jgi:hypothetical protein
MTPIKYKGYLIEDEDDPWAKKFGSKFKFSLEDGGERIHSASSIEDAKEQIDDGGLNNTCTLLEADSWSGGFAANH